MKEGFYKLDDGVLLHADGSLYNKNYEMHAHLKDTYTYPIDGWTWCDTLEEACDHFNLEINNYMEDTDEL